MCTVPASSRARCVRRLLCANGDVVSDATCQRIARMLRQTAVADHGDPDGENIVDGDGGCIVAAACKGNVDRVLQLYHQDPQSVHAKRTNGANAVIAAASTGNVSNCDAICALVERGSALKYHELPPSTERHHAGKLLEVAALLEDLAILGENSFGEFHMRVLDPLVAVIS